MPEGSVAVDGIDFEAEEDTQVETEDIENQDSGASEQKGKDKGQEPEGKEKPEGGSKKDAQVTEKGTKLDPDPMSALNQQLANERAKVRQFEQFLSNPDNLRRYLEEVERETGRAKAPQDEISIDKVQTVEDVQRFLNQEVAKIRAEAEEVKRLKYGLASQAVEEKVGSTITREVDEVRRKYPELRPTNADGSPNPDFDPDLEHELGELFDELDLDKRTGAYRGSVSLLKLADRLMKAAKRGQDQGSRRAQTLVQDRRTGRVISGGSSDSQPDESNLTASQTIAARMARARGRK